MNGAKYQVGEVVLAKYCDACNGQGTFEFHKDGVVSVHKCSECDAVGSIMTMDGLQLLRFVNDILLKNDKR